MKKTILSLLFIVLGVCTVFGMPGTVYDTATAKTNSVLSEMHEPIPPPHGEGHYSEHHMNVNDEIPTIAFVIPIAFFLFVLMIIGISQYFGHKKARLQTELYMEFLKQGKEIPDKLMIRQKDISSNLKRGVILISVGVGVCIFLFADAPGGTDWTLGIIPLLIGVGYLVVYKLSKGSEAKVND
jgi:hypothetical protein